jgi:hypothetical protein
VEERRIEEVAGLAERLGGAVAGVVPARRVDGVERFLCAFSRDDRFIWAVIDSAGLPINDEQAVRDVAELVAMCETAEEASSALAVGEALARIAAATPLAAGVPDAALALAALAEALSPLASSPGAVRVAEGSYLDQAAAAAAVVGDRFDLLKEAALAASARLSGAAGEEGEELAEALWALVRLLARDGAPDRFRESIEGSLGSAEAFADDVLANYLVALTEEDR